MLFMKVCLMQSISIKSLHLFGNLSQNLLRTHLHHHFEEIVPGLLLEKFPRLLSDGHGIFRLAGSLHFKFLRSVRHGDEPLEHHLPPHYFRLPRDGRLAVPVQSLQKRPFAIDADVRVHMIEHIEVFQRPFVARPTLNPDGSLRHGGQHLVPVEHAGGAFLHGHPVESRDGEEGGVHHSVVQFAQAGLHVAPEIDALQGGIDAHQLRLSSQRGGPDDAVVGEVLQRGHAAVFVDEGVVGGLALQVAGEDGAVGEPGGNVFHGVDADVHFVAEEGHVELLGEEAFAAQFHQGFVEDHVALGLHHADLQSAVFAQFGEVFLEQATRLEGLGHGEGGAAGADAQWCRSRLAHHFQGRLMRKKRKKQKEGRQRDDD
mmetsp:Transcript_8757/g.19256  ORF Transcript_8757/g.19256 Transcript_8757/m.19256 type:complete len:372 (-) Transcript_8757:376-1491(-)